MKSAPIPKNEEERLISLHKLGLLDTKPEDRFDRITRAATKIFKVPISTLTLVDSNREWFKSCVGLSASEGDRAISFCGHALLSKGIFVIPDTKKDKRFFDNPMVKGKPFIRFYAGVPIISADLKRIGVFCIKDIKPRNLSRDEKEILKNLAAWAELEVNSRNLSMALAEERKLQKQLEKDYARQKEIDKAKTEFVSMASHQLRTPLTAISWYTEMILRGDTGKINAEQKKYLEEIYHGNKRMIDLVNALLNVSRLELGTFETKPELVDFKEIAESVLSELKPQILERKLQVDKNYDLNLIKIYADPKSIRMIFQNLLSNAVKYVSTNGKIVLSISMQKTNFLITVWNNGTAIPKEAHSKIFTKFFRDDVAKEKDPDGNGLGLYIAKSIIEKMGGKIRFDSQKSGTAFYVTIPKNLTV